MQNQPLRKKNYNFFRMAPAKIVVLSFAVLILSGAVLLSMPFSSRSGQWTPFIDALFTATSASCITGLVIYDTFSYWSVAGQLIILLLIQTGAMGIVTLATFFSIMLKKKVGLKGMILAQESINFFDYSDVLKIIKKIVVVTLVVELTGAMLLSISFVSKFGPIGFYMGIFHSISAFCNAGFDITSAVIKGNFISMTPFNNDPIIMYTIPALIIIGGLGFSVWKDIFEFRKTGQMMFHTKLVLSITAFLLVSGTLLFLAAEFNNPKTLGPMSLWEKFNAAFFQSTTTRTAGFNSINLNDMREISKVYTVFLMFIGAAPGSTAGGIKVTTIGVLIMAVFSYIRGSGDIILFKRKILQNTVNKSLSIAGLSIILIMAITTIIVSIQPEFHIMDIIYETTSAFGTVGLSLGATSSLNTLSKLLIILTMFLGRVGPLSFAVALTLKASKRTSELVHPEAKILIG